MATSLNLAAVGDRNPTQVLQKLEERDQDALVGDEHAEEHQRKDNVRGAKSPFARDIAPERAKKRGNKRRQDDQDQAMERYLTCII